MKLPRNHYDAALTTMNEGMRLQACWMRPSAFLFICLLIGLAFVLGWPSYATAKEPAPWPTVDFPAEYEALLAAPLPSWKDLPVGDRLAAARFFLDIERLGLAASILADESLPSTHPVLALRARLASTLGDWTKFQDLVTRYDQALPAAPAKKDYTAESYVKQDETDALSLAVLLRSRSMIGFGAGKVARWSDLHPDWPALKVETLRWKEILEGRDAARQEWSALRERYGSLSFQLASARLLENWGERGTALATLLDALSSATQPEEVLALADQLKQLDGERMAKGLLERHTRKAKELTEALPFLPELNAPDERTKARLEALDPDHASSALALWFARYGDMERARRWFTARNAEQTPPDTDELQALAAFLRVATDNPKPEEIRTRLLARVEALPSALPFSLKTLELLLTAPPPSPANDPLRRIYRDRASKALAKAETPWQQLEAARVLARLGLNDEAKVRLSQAVALTRDPSEQAALLADALSWAKGNEDTASRPLTSTLTALFPHTALATLPLESLLLLHDGTSHAGLSTEGKRIEQELDARWTTLPPALRLRLLEDRILSDEDGSLLREALAEDLPKDELLVGVKLALAGYQQEVAWKTFHRVFSEWNDPLTLSRRLLPLLTDFRKNLVSGRRGAILSLDISQAMLLFLHKSQGDGEAFAAERIDQLASLAQASPLFNVQAAIGLRVAAWGVQRRSQRACRPLGSRASDRQAFRRLGAVHAVAALPPAGTIWPSPCSPKRGGRCMTPPSCGTPPKAWTGTTSSNRLGWNPFGKRRFRKPPA